MIKPVSTLLQTLIYGNIAMKMVFSFSMQAVWSTINTLHLLVHVPLINISLPANLGLFMSSFTTLFNVDVFNVNGIH
jgi:hypothetical protein